MERRTGVSTSVSAETGAALPSRPPPAAKRARENMGPLIAALLTLVIVLVVGYMCIQTLFAHRFRQPCRSLSASGPKEGYSSWPLYLPACGSPWLDGRRACRGITTGPMPSIDSSPVSWEPCCGYLGVPPPDSYPNPDPIRRGN